MQDYLIGALFALIGVVWFQLNWRLARIEKGLESKVPAAECELKRAVCAQRFETIEKETQP